MNWQLIDETDIKYYQYKRHNSIAIYTTKQGEEKILEKFAPIFLKQIHSDIIVDKNYENCRAGDGLITKRKKFALGIKIADCLPVYLFSDKKVCIIHCGWRGIIKGIAKKAAKIMGRYKYLLGASIGPCCYEVKEDIAKIFFQKYKRGVKIKNKRYFLDLKACVIEDLGSKNMLSSLDLCTHCHPEYFYSHRRQDTKRNYALILIL
jgi:YfiH family protein